MYVALRHIARAIRVNMIYHGSRPGGVTISYVYLSPS